MIERLLRRSTTMRTTERTIALVVLVLAGCAPAGSGPVSGTGGTGAGGSATGATGGGGAGGSGAPGTGGAAAGGSAPDGGIDGEPVQLECVENPVPLRTSGSIVNLPLDMFLEGKPLVYGEDNLLSSGQTVTPLDVRFYISRVELGRADGTWVPVDIVTEQRVPQPYNVHFFTADDATSRTLRVLAPAGAYTAVRFMWGLDFVCNRGSADSRDAPLSIASGMTWPHTGYLFFRYAAHLTSTDDGGMDVDASNGVANDAGVVPLTVIHMGGDLRFESAPVMRVPGTFSVPSTGSLTKGIRIIMDEIFRGAETDADLTGFIGPPGEEVLAGERLRRSAMGLGIFVFAP